MKEFALEQGKKLLSDEGYREKVLGTASSVVSGVRGILPRREKAAGNPFEEIVKEALSATPTKEDLALAVALLQSSSERKFKVVAGLATVNMVISLVLLVLLVAR